MLCCVAVSSVEYRLNKKKSTIENGSFLSFFFYVWINPFATLAALFAQSPLPSVVGISPRSGKNYYVFDRWMTFALAERVILLETCTSENRSTSPTRGFDHDRSLSLRRQSLVFWVLAEKSLLLGNARLR